MACFMIHRAGDGDDEGTEALQVNMLNGVSVDVEEPGKETPFLTASLNRLTRASEITTMRLKDLNTRMGKVESKLGRTNERGLRVAVALEHGKEYAEQKSADCIIDLVALIPSAVFPDSEENILKRICSVAILIAEDMIRDGVPEDFLEAFVTHVQDKTDNATDKADLARVLTEKTLEPIKKHLKGCDEWPVIKQIQNYFAAPEETKAQILASCKGPGILFMVYSTMPELMFGNKLKLYSDLEFDFRGRVNLFVTKDSITGSIDLGECKSSMDGSVVQQLAIRLNILKSVLTRCVQVRQRKVGGEATVNVTKIGRFFVPSSTASEEEKEEATYQAWKAMALDQGYSFHLHHL